MGAKEGENQRHQPDKPIKKKCGGEKRVWFVEGAAIFRKQGGER